MDWSQLNDALWTLHMVGQFQFLEPTNNLQVCHVHFTIVLE
jgi:hypothetical protein